MFNLIAEGLGGSASKLLAYGLGNSESAPPQPPIVMAVTVRNISTEYEVRSINTTPIGRGIDG